MLVLLSPAKDLDMGPVPLPMVPTVPEFLGYAAPLVQKLRGLSAKRLASLMDISPALAELNRARFAQWSTPFTEDNAKPAMLAFHGEVYRGFQAATLAKAVWPHAQQQVRILSGLYGVLRPMDLMQAYRLEMGTAFGVRTKDLYTYWGDRITTNLNAALQGAPCLVNLASTEYFKSVRTEKLNSQVVSPVFMDRSGGDYKVLMVHAKHQRGRMCRWIVEHRLTDPSRLREYDLDGYVFDPTRSTPERPVFLRTRKPLAKTAQRSRA
jgi:uncharacterized protein